METRAATAIAEPAISQSRPAIERIKSEDFFRLLIAELQQQDPFEPTKTSDMIGSVSRIRDMEQSQQLVATLAQLTRQQRTAGAGDLLGKYVEAVRLGADGTPALIAGVVTGVRFATDGTAVLELDTGQTVRASDVRRISTVDGAHAAAGQSQPPASEQSSDQPAATNPATAKLQGGGRSRGKPLLGGLLRL